jgi:hypothetical protein
MNDNKNLEVRSTYEGNYCQGCNNQHSCPLASYQFTFCPRMQVKKSSSPSRLYLSPERLEAFSFTPVN